VNGTVPRFAATYRIQEADEPPDRDADGGLTERSRVELFHLVGRERRWAHAASVGHCGAPTAAAGFTGEQALETVGNS